MKVSIRFDPRFAGMAVWIYDEKEGVTSVVEPLDLVMRKVDMGEIPPPTLVFGRVEGEEFLNSLVNALVEAGFKPNEIKAHNKEVEAIKYHLEDLRSLVFKKK